MHKLLLLVALASAHGSVAEAQSRPNDPAAVAMIDRALERMGGEALLRSVRSVRMDVLTQWSRINLGTHPFGDAPSYERNVELRDYATNRWRNTRTFLPSGTSVDVVDDTVASRSLTMPNGDLTSSALNIAYVDERRELFAFAPERTLILAKSGGGLQALADTVIDGVAHGRVRGSVDGYSTTWFLRRTDGLLAMLRFSADERNDFGLAPWGVMDVEFWYSNWVLIPPGVLLPRQRDVRRVGHTYKRMMVLTMTANAPAPSDSFAISDSLRHRYLSSQRAPMWDVDVAGSTISPEGFVGLPPFTGFLGAVRIGGSWVMLEAGQASGAAERTTTWLETQGARVAAVLVAQLTSGNGGLRWFAERRVPLYVAAGAEPLARHLLGETTLRARATMVRDERWVRVGSDSLWLARVELPDANGSLVAYSPTQQWLYAPLLAGRPAMKPELDAVVARLRARGLTVSFIGGARAVRTPLAP
jgi:hypothetical protein